MNAFPTCAMRDLVLGAGKVKPAKSDTPVWLLNLDQVESGSGRILNREVVSVDDLGPSVHPFETGAVLYSKLRPYLNKVVVADRSGYATTELVPLRCDTNRVIPHYLAYFLRSPRFLSFASNVVAGAKMPRMVMSEFWNYEVPLPSIAEQRRIAEILDKADALRAKRTQAIALLDRAARSMFLEMFGDHAAKSWTAATISAVASSEGGIRTGPFGSQLLHSEFVDEGVAVLGIDNAVANEFRWGAPRFITPTKFESLKRYQVSPGDVLITIMGTCGRCAIVPPTIPLAINTKHLCCITLDRERCLPEFLHSYFLMHPMALRYLQQKAKGAIMDGLNMGIIKEMPLPMAPIELQRAYASRVGAIHRIRQQHEQSLQTLDLCFTSLQHRAFTGTL